MIAARALQGCGAAILMAMTIALVSETSSKNKMGSAMGLLGTMSAIGTAMGPSLGGILIAIFSWRAIFFAMVPLGLINFFLTYRYLPASSINQNQEKLNFDLSGLFKLAMNLKANLLMNLLISTAVMSSLVVGPFYLSGAQGLSVAQVGLVMTVSPVMSIISGVFAGKFVDRKGPQSVILFGLIQMTIGMLSLSLLPTYIGVVGYVISVLILSPGYQLFQASNNTLVMGDVSFDQRGAVSGMLSLSRNVGLMLGTSMMGAVFTFAAQTNNLAQALPSAVANGMQTTFLVTAAFIFLALLIAVKTKKLLH